MNRLFVSLAALSFTLSAPALALADARPTPVSVDTAAGGRGAKAAQPMKAEMFRRIVDARIGKARAKLDKALENRDLSDAQRAEMRTDFERSVAIVDEAVTKAGADGTVTQKEAGSIRELVKDAKEMMRRKHGKAIGAGGKGQSNEHGPKS